MLQGMQVLLGAGRASWSRCQVLLFFVEGLESSGATRPARLISRRNVWNIGLACCGRDSEVRGLRHRPAAAAAAAAAHAGHHGHQQHHQDEGEDDEESPQLHRVGVGQRLQLLPDLAEDAQRLLPGVHPTRARQRSGLRSGPRGGSGRAPLQADVVSHVTN